MHIVLVRPEYGGNVGSAARVLENMGIRGRFIVVGNPGIVNGSCRRMAKNAQSRVDSIEFYPNLKDALEGFKQGNCLSLGATARIGSASRPHRVWVREAMERAVGKLAVSEIDDLVFVFGPESSGLDNNEIRLCDWVVSIPSVEEYRSLNLAQAVLVFAYEAQLAMAGSCALLVKSERSQKDRLIRHVLELAEEVGFIFPEDPQKMRPKLERLLNELPNHIEGVRTLHGFIDQCRRSIKCGAPDYRGRYKRLSQESSLIDRIGE